MQIRPITIITSSHQKCADNLQWNTRNELNPYADPIFFFVDACISRCSHQFHAQMHRTEIILPKAISASTAFVLRTFYTTPFYRSVASVAERAAVTATAVCQHRAI